ncbi:M3 family metallopeptidase [Oleiharenicola lentus]|uniref:M3 family metallopeptidase n=1 Tax=Oleiharenicola lentus TaxID=2508720 RepID=UPI003F67297A
MFTMKRSLRAPAAALLLSAAFTTMSANPLLTESPLPYQLPPFEQIKNEHFLPAFEQGMTENLKEIDVIANNPAAPTFDNTIVALERSGELLSRAVRAFGIYTGSFTNLELQKLESQMAPRFSAHGDAIRLNPKLFARIAELHAKRDSLGLDAESNRLLDRYYKDYVRGGAKLSDADKAKLRALNTEIAKLSTQFSQNVLKEINASAVIVDTREELAGLSDAAIATAAAAAKTAGKEGKFAIVLTNTTGQPPLNSLQNRAVRQRVMAASLARGSHGGDFDNRAIVSSIAKLRAERANLLGYPTHAALQLEEQTAGSVDVVNKLLAQLAPPAVANAKREAADMQKLVDAEKGNFKIEAADWDFYTSKVRQARYAYDEAQLRPYYEMRRVLVDGVFFAATKLYGITFKERKDLKGYSPDMFVFEVFNEDGTPLALFLADLYARPTKRGGAWASAYVPQNSLRGTKPVIGNHLNVPKPPAGEPTLMTHDEVNTLFHEFGHALHGMFSNVKYPRFAGTSVPRDFVEYPSQVNEMWATWPEILKNYAKHYQTGAPIPPALIEKVIAADKFNQGFATTELVAANVIDQAWYQLKTSEVPGADDALAFEAAVLKKYGLDFAPVPPRYRTTYFSHVFSGGYSAGYYSYFWSEVLDAASVDWMKTHGGLTRKNGDHFRSTLLSRGGSQDAMEMYRNFTGAEPDIKPLLKRRGLDSASP